ncbi:MAG: GAF domain-containing protein [Anaerolineae bacterium]|nr:GAF domain-containing protein [Anaerolineae bacterium]
MDETPLRVLLIEDSEDDATLTMHVLQRGGYALDFERVETAERMREALKRQEWDIIVCDYILPRFNGLQALEILKESELDIPFIVVSGLIGEEVAVAAMRAGAHDYVMKDKLARLVPAVRREIHEARVRQAARRSEEKVHQLSRAVYEIGNDISASLDLFTVLTRVATHARDLLEAEDSEVYLIEEETNTLRAIVTLSKRGQDSKAESINIGEGIVGSIVQSGRGEVVDDVEQDPRSATASAGSPPPSNPVSPENDVAQHHSMVCAPLIFNNQVIGALALSRRCSQEPFTQADLDFLTSLAPQAAIAIENARSYRNEQQRAAQLARALEQQRHLDSLKDQFVQNVSHELRTPIAIARGYAELLDSGELGNLENDQQEAIGVIARRMRLLTRLVDDINMILELESEPMVKQTVDMAQLVSVAVAHHTERAERLMLKLTTQIAPDLPHIRGNPGHLERMLDNLLDNALKFTPEGGVIQVRLSQESAALHLDVSDTGIGIPEEQLPQLFQRFYQIDGSMSRRYGGTGLGLALIKQIVEAHGGMVHVTSRVNKGSIFHVILPTIIME